MNQVFYIEKNYNEVINNFICSHYLDMKCMFNRLGMEFNYLPYLVKEQAIEAKVRYYAPYLSLERLTQNIESNTLVRFIYDEKIKEQLQPSIIFWGHCDCKSGHVKFLHFPLSDFDLSDFSSLQKIIAKVQYLREESYRANPQYYVNIIHDKELNRQRTQREFYECPPETSPAQCTPAMDDNDSNQRHTSKSGKGGVFNRILRSLQTQARVCSEESSADMSSKAEEDAFEELSKSETAQILHDLRMTVQRLRLEGVSLMAIHEFIDKQEPLSCMKITSDYRIFLPDYNNMVIEMGALPKAVYFLFLRYPEGIIYKHIPDFYNELLGIYKQLRPNTEEERLIQTISKVVNPLGNALNENIARIRKAFVEKFDEHLAQNYIISGERGLQYSIPLDRNLISWEE